MAEMMACGHAANAVRGDGAPTCAICAGIDPGAVVVIDAPDLTGRLMKCGYGRIGRYGKPGDHDPRPSTLDAAFFGHHPDREFDEFYCGCWGWD